jgi:hypothetical protein
MSQEESTEDAPKSKASRGPRSFAERAQRSVKDADRALKQNPDRAPEEQATAQLEQAKVWALLDLADAIRESRSS